MKVLKAQFVDEVLIPNIWEHTTDAPRTRDDWWATIEEMCRLRRMADLKMGRSS